MSRLAIPALAALAFLLAGVVAAELAMPGKTPDPVTEAAPAAAASKASPQGASADQVASLLARPPFNPDRRPMPEAADAPATATAAVALPRLTGIMVAQGRREAIFAGASAGKAILVGEGDMIAGFRVQSIKAGEVTLQNGEALHAVQPHYASATGAEPPAAVPFALNPAPSGFDILNHAPPTPNFVSGRPALGAAR